MKRLWLWMFVVFAAAAGFVLGRATGTLPLPGLTDIRKDFPLFPAPPKPDAPAAVETPSLQENDIVVEVPVDGMTVSDAFIDVAGRAKTAGGPLRLRVLDASGAVVAESDMDVSAGGGEAYGRFGRTFIFKDKPSGVGTVEISRTSGQGGVTVRRVAFASAPPTGELTVKAFFRYADGECDSVLPVSRPFDGKTAIYRAALEALLKGPTAEEKAQSYTTSVPANVRLKSVAADANGLVTADFSEPLNRGVRGACSIAGARAQIEAALRQFPEVHGVVISVNGKTDGVLKQ